MNRGRILWVSVARHMSRLTLAATEKNLIMYSIAAAAAWHKGAYAYAAEFSHIAQGIAERFLHSQSTNVPCPFPLSPLITC